MGKSILVVDDDAELRDVIGQLLRAKGWSVATAADGLEALGMVQVTVPAIVLTDVEMPRMGGLELTGILHQLPKPPRVLLMSGKNSPFDGENCPAWDSEVTGFLNKPLGEEALLSALEKICTGEDGLRP